MTTELVDSEYPSARPLLAEDRQCVLKSGDTYVIVDRRGDILGDLQGLYHNGTRYLSHLEMLIDGAQPQLLSSVVNQDNVSIHVELTAAEWDMRETHSLHLSRYLVLMEDKLIESVRVTNFSDEPRTLQIGYHMRSDFRDIFEIRGMQRAAQGSRHMPRHDRQSFCFGYTGIDQVVRRLVVHPSEPGSAVKDGWLFEALVEDTWEYSIVYECQQLSEHSEGSLSILPSGFLLARAIEESKTELARKYDAHALISTSSANFNRWIERSVADLSMLQTQTRDGNFLYAGLPWESHIVSRVALIAGMQTLFVSPNLSRDVLLLLAKTQARRVGDGFCSQPGRVLHQRIESELNVGTPSLDSENFASIDTTPLFITLMGQYFRSTGDRSFLQQMRPALERAVDWLDHIADKNTDGFLQYQWSLSSDHQGWRNSPFSIYYRDGRPAGAKISPIETQTYLIAAYSEWAAIELASGNDQESARYNERANDLVERFEDMFWSNDFQTYGLALDDDRLCIVKGSHLGHCLYAGIASADRAGVVARSLLAPESFNGWALRTVYSDQARYNPLAPHHGACWPHESAIACAGLARYGYKRQASELVEGLFAAASVMEFQRLPSYFCGLERSASEHPALSPAANMPHAWSAGSVFMMLQACLGLQVDGIEGAVQIERPILPASLQSIRVQQLKVGTDGEVDIEFLQTSNDVEVRVLRRQGDVKVRIIK